MINHEHFHLLKFAVNKELNELYISIVLRSLAFSTVLIFIPLYLFKELNFSLNEIIYFYLISSIVFALFTIPAAKFVEKIGLKKVILISMFIYISFFWMLNHLKINPNLIYYAAFLLGLADALFWISFHLDFATFSDRKKRGEEIGIWYSFSIMAGLVGPLIGGVILTFANYNLLFIVVAILLLGSTIPLFMSKDIKKKVNISMGIFKKAKIRDNLAYTGSGMLVIASIVFWPIFIYTILKGYLLMGSLVTIVGIANILFIFVTGKLTDKYKKRKLIKIGSIFHAITWFIRAFVKTKVQLATIAIFGGMSSMFMNIPFSARFYDKCKNNEVNYLIIRELSMNLGKIIILLLVLLNGNLISSFWYATIGSLLHMLL